MRWLDALADALGDEAVLTAAADRAAYGYDATYREGLPEAVVLPRSTEQVAAVLRIAQTYGVPVFPRGAGTGLSGGAVPRGGIALVLTGMDRILALERENLLLQVEAGVVTRRLQEAAEAAGLWYPVDPGSAATCTVGGNVAENAGGARSFQYGVTGDYVLGLTAVLMGGEVIRTGGRTKKNVTGYDLTRLLVGSEGTLAVVTEVTLRLLPRPAAAGTLLAAFASVAQASRAVAAFAADPARPTSIELTDRHSMEVVAAYAPGAWPGGAEATLLCEVLGWPSEVEERLRRLAALARAEGAGHLETTTDTVRQRQLWAARAAISPAVARLKPTKISEDATVPVAAIPAFLKRVEAIRQETGVAIFVFGHAGDGNLHPNIVIDRRDAAEAERAERAIALVFEAALALGGTLSGEHGVGLLKRAFMHEAVSAASLTLMRRVKAAFDPLGLLNPGKLLPD